MLAITMFALAAPLITNEAGIISDPPASVHPERAAQIETVRSSAGVRWHAAPHPRFSSLPPGASKPLCGVRGDWKAQIQAALKEGTISQFVPRSIGVAEGAYPNTIPDSFDAASKWPQCARVIGDIRDQSNCGCCWAFAGAEAASDRLCIGTNASVMVPLSAQDVCFCAGGLLSRGCDGGQIDTPWTFIKHRGVVTGGQYKGSGPFGAGFCSDFSLPHCHHHGPQRDDPFPAEGAPGCPSERSAACPRACDTTAGSAHADFAADKVSFTGKIETASGETAIQQMIMQGGPVETAFNVFTDFEDYAGGIYHHVTGGPAGGHAVKFVGWGVENGVKYWKVANSWNPYWGEHGYFRILRGVNEGGIEDQVVASAADAVWGKATALNAAA